MDSQSVELKMQTQSYTMGMIQIGANDETVSESVCLIRTHIVVY